MIFDVQLCINIVEVVENPLPLFMIRIEENQIKLFFHDLKGPNFIDREDMVDDRWLFTNMRFLWVWKESHLL